MTRPAIAACVVMGAAITTAGADAADSLGHAPEIRTSAKASNGGKTNRPLPGTARRNPAALYSRRRAKLLPVVRSASVENLPAGLVDTVISRESKYNITARGSQGEIGLMQILPPAARLIAGWLGHKRVTRLSGKALRMYLTRPGNNIRYGTAYLARCHKMANL